MANLTLTDHGILERAFQMSAGWVLDLTNRTLPILVNEATGKNIDDPIYHEGSNSKARRLRKFWQVEPDRIVGLLIEAMARHAATLTNVDQTLIPPVREIAQRLLKVGSVADLDAIAPSGASRAFDALALEARAAIENNNPERGIDRLHTYVISYLRRQCEQNGLQTDRDEPLNSVYGSYLRLLRQRGLIRSDMAEKILRMSFSTLEAFNHVRNEQSLAHDNEILDSDESLFIYNHICALVRFLQRIDPPSGV